jgi:hypothetical protein
MLSRSFNLLEAVEIAKIFTFFAHSMLLTGCRWGKVISFQLSLNGDIEMLRYDAMVRDGFSMEQIFNLSSRYDSTWPTILLSSELPPIAGKKRDATTSTDGSIAHQATEAFLKSSSLNFLSIFFISVNFSLFFSVCWSVSGLIFVSLFLEGGFPTYEQSESAKAFAQLSDKDQRDALLASLPHNVRSVLRHLPPFDTFKEHSNNWVVSGNLTGS